MQRFIAAKQPSLKHFEDEARALDGRAYDARVIARRYGAQIGYWSFYLKTGLGRRAPRTPGTAGEHRLRVA
jgi:hypothetical protein